METHIVVAILLFISILMFGTLNSSQFDFEVANRFTHGKAIEIRVLNSYKVVAEGKVLHSESGTWTITTDHVTTKSRVSIFMYKCHVTQLGLGEGKSTYYGFFNFTSHLLHNSFKSLVNEEGAFKYSNSSGYQLLYSWLKLEFYVYNKFNITLQLSILHGGTVYLKTEEVEPGAYLQWTRPIIEPSNVRHFKYICSIKLSIRKRKLIEVFDSSSIDASLLQQHKTMFYTYAVNDDGIGVYNPATSEYNHMHSWSPPRYDFYFG